MELDVAALEQADLYGKWAERAAESAGVADELELAADQLAAKVEIDVRDDPKAFGSSSEKPNEGAIKAIVADHPPVRAAKLASIKAKTHAKLMGAAERSLAQRKSMIEELVKLHGQKYFAGPDVPRNLAEIWKQRVERRGRDVNERQAAGARKRMTPNP